MQYLIGPFTWCTCDRFFHDTYRTRTNEILNESNEIAGLQKRLELSGREVLLLQNELDNKISNMSDRTLEMGQVDYVHMNVICLFSCGTIIIPA